MRGRLMEAPGPSERDALLADAALLGLTPAQVDQMQAATRRDPSAEGIWPENAPTIRAWLSVASQWRVSGAVYLGLDYAGVRAALDALAITVGPDLWSGLQVMEFAARDVLNAQLNR